jgi:hypothetical protein
MANRHHAGFAKKVIDASANSSARTPSQSWDRPRIYVHLANDSQRPAAEALKKRMTSSGYVVLGTDNASGNVDVPTEASELRYFTPADSGEAQRIAEELKPILGNVIASRKQCRTCRTLANTRSGFHRPSTKTKSPVMPGRTGATRISRDLEMLQIAAHLTASLLSYVHPTLFPQPIAASNPECLESLPEL